MSFDQQFSPASYAQPPIPSIREPTKDAFQFIQIHQASGRPDAEGGAQMRAHIKRIYFENRRRRAKRCPHAKGELRSKQNVHSVIPPVVLDARHLQAPPATPPRTERYLSRSPEVGLSESQENRTSISSIGDDVVCLECARLLFRRLTNEEQRRDGTFGSSQALLGYTSYDPFNSAVIKINHQMHEFIHYCM
jgi:hypothetical protein